MTNHEIKTEVSLPDDESTNVDAAHPASRPIVSSYTSDNAEHHWSVESYPAELQSAAAQKLFSSEIAPLVAIARGVEFYTTKDHLDDANRRIKIDGHPSDKAFGDRRTNQFKRLLRETTGGGVMTMPWYSPAVLLSARNGESPLPSAIQYRPTNPEADLDDKVRKYEFIGGHSTPVGIHPAIPVTWLSDTSIPLLVAEGQLKGDAALSAMLIDSGVNPDDLTVDDGLDAEVARTKLRDLIASVPDDRRVLIATISGVYNWRKNAQDWNNIATVDRDVWVGVDGDVATKRQVWDAANALWEFLEGRKCASIKLIAPIGATPTGPDTKIGIDDYLHSYGDWTGLLEQLTPELPPPPTTENAVDLDAATIKRGVFRVAADGCSIEQARAITDEAGKLEDVVFDEYYPLGGRIRSVEQTRVPTEDEIRGGAFDVNAFDRGSTDYQVELEVSWRDTGNGQVQTVTVAGSSKMLGLPPTQWATKIADLVVPSVLQVHPMWPPRGEQGDRFLEAIKANRADEIERRTRWSRMGWVPQPGSNIPVYVAGEDVVGSKEEVESVVSAVDEAQLPGAENFGVGDGDLRVPFDDPAYQKQLRDDLETMLDRYVTGQKFRGDVEREHASDSRNITPYRDRTAVATLIAASLKPVLPTPNTVIVWIDGTAGGGKSYTAGAGMAFWAAKPGAFSAKRLPGGANDTMTAVESCIAQSMIWTIDDVAPSSSARKASEEQAMLESIVRSVFQQSAKRRGTITGGQRERKVAHALLLVTAESEPQVQSIKERTVRINIRRGSLSPSRVPTRNLEAIYMNDCVPARVTQGFIKYIRYLAEHYGEDIDPADFGEGEKIPRQGWAGLYDEMLREESEWKNRIAAILDARSKSGQTTRPAETGAALCLTLLYLGRMARDLGVGDDTLNLLTDVNVGLIHDVIENLAQSYDDSTSSRLSQRVVRSLASMLYAGKAHVVRGDNPKALPDDDVLVAQRLGWEVSENRSAPRGPMIGCLLEREGEKFVLFNAEAAYAALVDYAVSIIGHGVSSNAVWQSIYEDHLFFDKLPRKVNTSDGERKESFRQQARLPKTAESVSKRDRMYGVAISLQVLFNQGTDMLDDDEDDDE